MIEDLKRNAANDRDFLKKELERKIADLEQELIDERFKKKINYEVTIESIKCQV
jgi:ribosomal protein L29